MLHPLRQLAPLLVTVVRVRWHRTFSTCKKEKFERHWGSFPPGFGSDGLAARVCGGDPSPLGLTIWSAASNSIVLDMERPHRIVQHRHRGGAPLKAP